MRKKRITRPSDRPPTRTSCTYLANVKLTSISSDDGSVTVSLLPTGVSRHRLSASTTSCRSASAYIWTNQRIEFRLQETISAYQILNRQCGLVHYLD